MTKEKIENDNLAKLKLEVTYTFELLSNSFSEIRKSTLLRFAQEKMETLPIFVLPFLALLLKDCFYLTNYNLDSIGFIRYGEKEHPIRQFVTKFVKKIARDEKAKNIFLQVLKIIHSKPTEQIDKILVNENVPFIFFLNKEELREVGIFEKLSPMIETGQLVAASFEIQQDLACYFKDLTNWDIQHSKKDHFFSISLLAILPAMQEEILKMHQSPAKSARVVYVKEDKIYLKWVSNSKSLIHFSKKERTEQKYFSDFVLKYKCLPVSLSKKEQVFLLYEILFARREEQERKIFINAFVASLELEHEKERLIIQN